MNPQDQTRTTEHAKVVDPDLLKQIVEEMEAANPYGGSKYSDEDAKFLGIESLGSLRLANQLVKAWWGSPMIPAWIQKAQNPAGTFVSCVLRGKELGFQMMESLGCLYMSPDGRLGMYGTAMLALMRKSGISLSFAEVRGDDGEAFGMEVYGKRKDGDEYTARFTLADVKKAGLGNVHNKYPIVMCKWRAVSDLFRTLASDLSGGPLYTREELEEELRDQGYYSPEDATVLNREPAAQEANPFVVTVAPVSPPADTAKPLETKAPVPPASNAAFQAKAAELNDRAAQETSSQTAEVASASTEAGPPSAPPAAGETQAAEPTPTEPTRATRGRGKAKPETTAAPEPPTQSNVVEMPKSGYQATDDDVPFGTPKQQESFTQLERINRVVDLLSGTPRPADTMDRGTPWFAAKLKVQGFLRGFVNKEGLLPVPQNKPEMEPVPDYVGVIQVMEALAASKPKDILDNANMAGLQAGVGYNDLIRHADKKKWPMPLAMQAALSQYAYKPSDLIEFVELKGEPPIKGDENLATFLALVKRSRALAGKVRTFCNESGVDMADLMVGLDLSACSEGDILGRITGGTPKSAGGQNQEELWQE